MTRKEIINEIKCLLSELNNGEDAVSYLTQNDVKWLNENIKALEQESTDCVSRQALYDALYERFHEEDTNNITNVTLGSVRNFVKDFPSITPQLSSELDKNSKKLEKDFGESDCISRAYLLDDSKYHTVFNDDTGNFEDVVYREDIEKAPSVTPQEPRKGHWIGHREHCENLGVMPSGLGAYEWCSNCDCGIDVREWHRIHYNYCPNCGADMREVKE